MSIKFKLPFPPSVNTYWRTVGNRVLLSSKGRSYKKMVYHEIGYSKKGYLFDEDARLKIHVEIYAPDKRKRDIDNCAKAILDAIGYAGIYKDDCQIDYLLLERKEIAKGNGYVIVSISEIMGK